MKAAPVSESALAPYQGQKLAIVTYQKSDFVAMTQTIALTSGLFGAIGGAIGGSVAIDNGNKLVADDAVPDPAVSISARLLPQVRATLKSSAEETLPGVSTKLIDEATLSKLAGNSGVTFEVQTVNWGSSIFRSARTIVPRWRCVPG
jgi:hypothetical protein